MSPIIRFEHVSKSYRLQRDQPRSFRDLFLGRGRRGQTSADKHWLWALRDVSFGIERGETVGLIGPNGAGKSTALKLISRVMAPTTGRLEVGGRVAALLELGTGFHPELSGRDNIFLSGALIGMSRSEIMRKYTSMVDFSELAEFMEMPVKHYSSGMFARLAFAVSIHLDPEILLVDEVLAVGDQDFQQKCLDRIARLQREGVTICLVTHSLDNVRSMCKRAIWFDHGRIVVDGSSEAVVRQYLDHTLATEARRLAGAGATEAASPQRWGSRRIEIERLWLTDSHGEERTVFETGECLVLRLDYQAHEPTTAPIFGMAIHRQDGLHVCGPNTAFAGLVLPTLAGAGAVRYTVPYLPLLDGLYHISAAVVSHNNKEVYDYHDRLYPFRVVNTPGRVREQYGAFTLQGEWDHTLA